jgi:signal peptidase II
MKITTSSICKFFSLILILFFLDQLTKYAARATLEQGQVFVLVPYFLELFYVENTGISWGMFAGLPPKLRFWFLLIVPSFFVFLIFSYALYSWSKLPRLQKLGFALILGGALGNLYDRFIFQSVTDFMHFRFFSKSLFINNLADDFISIGLCALLWKDVSGFFKNIISKKK